jgi:hypothetical protein
MRPQDTEVSFSLAIRQNSGFCIEVDLLVFLFSNYFQYRDSVVTAPPPQPQTTINGHSSSCTSVFEFCLLHSMYAVLTWLPPAQVLVPGPNHPFPFTFFSSLFNTVIVRPFESYSSPWHPRRQAKSIFHTCALMFS